ncbi:MAG: TonB-dependent receptor, partial [Calditrichota bacterium]
MSYNQIPRQQVRGIGQKLLYDSISRLKFKLQTNNRQHTPLVAYIFFVFVLIPKISGNILSIIGVPDTEICNQVRFTETETPVCPDIHLLQNRSLEQDYKLRNLNHFRLNKTYTLEFGIEAKHLISSYNNFFTEYTDALGETVPAFQFNGHVTANKFGTFVNLITKPFNRLTTTVGLRADYFSYNENSHISPRFSFSYQLTDRTAINGSYGLFYQNLPMILLSQNEANQKLKDPSATHYVLGIDHLLTENTKLTLEIYRKDYRNFPIDVAQPALFLIDELFYRYGFFFNHGPLTDTGQASAQGV